jgi:dephospho-CoA kinase
MWLGRSFAGGKSTTARVLAESYGLEVYHVDRDIITNPELESVRMADPEWFWLPVSAKLERYRKVISHVHVFEQARVLSETDDIIAEGPCLLPEFLDNNKIKPSDAVVLVPTPEHQRFANTKRRKHWSRDILDDFDDKTKA